MQNLSFQAGVSRSFALSIVAILALLLTAACGDDDDSTPGASLDQTPAASMTTPAGTESTPASASTETTTGTPSADATMPAGTSMEEIGEIGACFEENTDAEMIEDLRAGDTASAEEVYATCLEDMLPASVVAELEPVLEQAAACGETATADLSDDDVAALEAGDRQIAEQVSIDTLECLSEQLGIPLS